MKLGRLALYGGGKMGFALLKGWIDAGMVPANIAVYDPKPSQQLKDSHVEINPSHFEADIVLIAVKPQVVEELLKSVSLPKHALKISVAAGVTLAQFEKYLGADARIIRAMPNTPAAIGEGITAIVGNQATRANDLTTAENLLSAVGAVVRLDKESDMDAVTGLSGSGPAYVFHMIEALSQAGVAQGLSEELARKLALVTVGGAGKLALVSNEDASQLRENVTSPGGTTQAGLKVLMDKKSGLVPLMTKTVAAAADRSRALAQIQKEKEKT